MEAKKWKKSGNDLNEKKKICTQKENVIRKYDDNDIFWGSKDIK